MKSNEYEKLLSSLNARQQDLLKQAFSGDELARLWLNPHLAMSGLDAWQIKVLKTLVPFERDCICNCSRQSGKSTVVSLASYLRGCTGQFVLVISASDRQAVEFLVKLKKHHARLGLVHLIKETEHEIDFASGGKVLALPKSETTIVGFSAVDLLVIDEAARVPDNIYNAVRPMLITSRGTTALLSSPFGQRGFFYQEWMSGNPRWKRFRVSWRECPRILPQDIEAERNKPGVLVQQEYLDSHLPKTKVATIGGDKEVSTLQIGDVLYVRGGRVCEVTEVRQAGTRLTQRVTTESGTVFEASECHKVMSASSEVRLKDATTLTYCWYPKYPSGTLERLARIVGYNLGDGSVHQHSAYFFSKNKADMDRLREDLLAVGLSKRATVRIKKGKYPCYTVSTSGNKIKEYGAVEGKKITQAFDVPDWILKGSKEVKKEFLAALFGAEGSTPSFNIKAYKRATKNYTMQCFGPRTLTLCMVKKAADDGIAFFNSLVAMLSELGVESRYTIKQVTKELGIRYYFILSLLGGQAGAKAYFDNVGYRYAEDKEHLAFYGSLYLGAKLRTSTWSETFEDWVNARAVSNGIAINIVNRIYTGQHDTINIEVNSPDRTYLLADGMDNHNCAPGEEFLATVGGFFNVPAWDGLYGGFQMEN